MKTWQLALLVGIIIIVGVGAMIFLRNRDNNSDTNGNTNTSTNTNSQSSGTSTDNSNQSNTNTVETMDEAIDIKNKFVTLSVAGYGDIKVELYDEDAPKTVENFLRLTQRGYYDGITFHRIAKNFVIQGGDPTGTGSGGDSAFGGEFADELNPSTPSGQAGYKKGVLAMANRGPNTNTSQFFIMLDDNQLPYNYTIFGKVVSGLDVVDKIGQAEINPQMGSTDGSPKEKITITKATISSN